MRLLVVSCAPLVSSFTLSLACLRSTAVTVHDAAETDPFHAAHLSYCGGTPFYAYTSSCLSFVFHTQSHTLMLLLMSRFVFTLAACQLCFDVLCPPGPPSPLFPPCPSASVMSELRWNLTSHPSGDDTPDESLNQYLPVPLFFCL